VTCHSPILDQRCPRSSLLGSEREHRYYYCLSCAHGIIDYLYRLLLLIVLSFVIINSFIIIIIMVMVHGDRPLSSKC
jgi:hypothetical protein